MLQYVYMERYLTPQVIADLKRKMVFIAGPRQCGKTTLALAIESAKDRYLNWDSAEDRENILKHRLPPEPGILIFDEIHKYMRWRNYLKGLYDKEKSRYNILVTGSARLDVYRRGGDSLQGRYHFLRLHALSLRELASVSQQDYLQLLELGPFPEPFFSGSQNEARRWSREYRSRLVREDIAGLERISDLGTLEQMVLQLPKLVGSPLSLNGLREDLSIAFATAKRWIEVLENLYVIFRIYPFGNTKIRAVKKEPKHYHFDWSLVESSGARFENLIACHLLKWCHWVEDTEGYDYELRYFKDNEKREVDFVVVKDGKPILFVECKSSDTNVSTSLKYLKRKFPEVRAVQVMSESPDHFINKDGIEVISAIKFLNELV